MLLRTSKSDREASPVVAIIGGLSRSGTSVLWRTCNRHPVVGMTYEFANFRGLGRRYWVYRRLLVRRWTEQRFQEQEWLERSFRRAYLRRLRRYLGRSIDAQVLGSVLQSSFPGARVVGDKYPRYVFMLNELTKDSHLKRVIIYRDCRDVTSSVLKQVRTQWKGREFARELSTAEQVARRWRLAIEMMEEYRDHLFVIRYEDLVQNPKPVLQGLGEYLGVQSSEFPIAHIRADRIGNYRQGLSQDELSAVMTVAEPTMRRLGYV